MSYNGEKLWQDKIRMNCYSYEINQWSMPSILENDEVAGLLWSTCGAIITIWRKIELNPSVSLKIAYSLQKDPKYYLDKY